MSEKMVREKIAKTILNLADAMETGSFQEKPLIGIAVSETEHGLDNIREGVRIAESRGFRAVIIDGEDAHKHMEEMLESGEIQALLPCIIHFPDRSVHNRKSCNTGTRQRNVFGRDNRNLRD